MCIGVSVYICTTMCLHNVWLVRDSNDLFDITLMVMIETE